MGAMARNQAKNKRKPQDQKVTPLLKTWYALTFISFQIVLPITEPDISQHTFQGRNNVHSKVFALFQEKWQMAFSIVRRDYFLHYKHRHD